MELLVHMVSASSCFLYRVYRVKHDRNIQVPQMLIQHYYCAFFYFLLHGAIRTIGTLLVLLENCSWTI